jgi:hypothetical protein
MALIAESVLWALPVTDDGTPAGPARRLTDEPADHPSWSIHDGLPRRQADLTALRQAGHARPPHGTTWLETARAMQRGSCCGVQ